MKELQACAHFSEDFQQDEEDDVQFIAIFLPTKQEVSFPPIFIYPLIHDSCHTKPAEMYQYAWFAIIGPNIEFGPRSELELLQHYTLIGHIVSLHPETRLVELAIIDRV